MDRLYDTLPPPQKEVLMLKNNEKIVKHKQDYSFKVSVIN